MVFGALFAAMGPFILARESRLRHALRARRFVGAHFLALGASPCSSWRRRGALLADISQAKADSCLTLEAPLAATGPVRDLAVVYQLHTSCIPVAYQLHTQLHTQLQTDVVEYNAHLSF